MTQSFGTLLRHLRRKNGMTQAELAERLGYSRSMVAALETDRRMLDVDAVRRSIVPAFAQYDSREIVDELVALAARAHPTALQPLPLARFSSLPVTASRNGLDTFQVPLPPARLFGRERETQLFCDQFLYHNIRLLTLVGPPGVGKTTLALATATLLQGYLPDGACFVALAGVTSIEAAPAVILEALGLRQQAGSALQALVANLRRKEMLLVLDNFEQILGAAPIVAQLIAECPGLRILVTSRERLHLRAEHVQHVQPLTIEDAADLFLARVADSGSTLDNGDRALVESICFRVDCLPLAIELCAARTDFFTPQQILAQLETRTLDVLVDGAVDLPPRQRTLRATIHASYSLLDVDERRVLQALAIFANGCSPAMLAEVWTADDEEATHTNSLLRSLVAKSLVRLESTEWGDRRASLLESIREYARERLEEGDEYAGVRSRQVDAMLAFARVGNPMLWGVDRPLWFKRMRLELDNLYVSLDWAFEHEEWVKTSELLFLFYEPVDSASITTDFFMWFDRLLPHRHHLDAEHKALLEIYFCNGAHVHGKHEQKLAILDHLEVSVEACSNLLIKATALVYGVLFHTRVGQAPSMDGTKRAIAYARAAQTTPEHIRLFGYGTSRENILPLALRMYGIQLADHGEAVQSGAYLRENLELQRELHGGITDPYNIAYLGRVAMLEGNFSEAIRRYEEALELANQIGAGLSIITWSPFLGQALLYAGDQEGARRVLDQAWEACNSYGDPFVMQIAAIFLSELAFWEGKSDSAHDWLSQAIDLSARSSRDLHWRHIHRAMLAARLAAMERRDERAAQLYGFMHNYSDRIKIGPTGPVRDTAAATMAEVRARMGEQAYWDAYKRGREMPVYETFASLIAEPS